MYLSLIVLIPLAAMFVHAAQLTQDQFWAIISAPRVLAALKLSFGTALYAAIINGVIGTLLAWVLVRYTFPGRKVIDAMIDLPFALPTAVAGIALTALYTPPAWWVSSRRTWVSRSRIPPRHHPGADFCNTSIRSTYGTACTGRYPREVEEAAACLGQIRCRFSAIF